MWKSMNVYGNVTEETTQMSWASVNEGHDGNVDILDDLAYNLCFLCGANID